MRLHRMTLHNFGGVLEQSIGFGPHVTVVAGDDVRQGADVSTGGAGTIHMTAGGATADGPGDGLLMGAGTTTSTLKTRAAS